MSQSNVIALMSAVADTPTADDLLGLTAVSEDDVFSRMERVDVDFNFDLLTNEDAEEMTARYADYPVGYDPYTGSITYDAELDAELDAEFGTSITSVMDFDARDERAIEEANIVGLALRDYLAEEVA
jgi:hypothetical protein